MKKIRPLQADLSYQGEFSAPAFGLIGSLAGLLERAHSRLASFGIRPSDLKLESTTPSLTEASLVCNLITLGALVRVRLERIEASFSDLKRVDQEQISTVVLESFEAVRDILPNLTVKTHGITLQVHGVLEGISFEDLIRYHAPNPPAGLGPALGSGVVYYFGPEAERVSSGFVLDKSFVVPGGLYLRANVNLDGTKVPILRLREMASEYIDSALKTLGLELNWSA